MRTRKEKVIGSVLFIPAAAGSYILLPFALVPLFLDGWLDFIPQTIACAVLGIVALVLLLRLAGPFRMPEKGEDVPVFWYDRIPYDVLLVITAGYNIFSCIFYFSISNVVHRLNYYNWVPAWCIVTGFLLALAGSALLLLLVMTTGSRIRSRTFSRHWAVVSLGRAIRKWANLLPHLTKTVICFLLYCLVSAALVLICVFCTHTIFPATWIIFAVLDLLFQVWIFTRLGRWILQWRAIRAGTDQILKGNLEARIDHTDFYPDLKEHAEQLGELGKTIDQAVEVRLKSERFSADLITNVSHDLKTPLTSIINYVDLLKKEDLHNSTAEEYVQVLDRKSQQLKKLTEDLIEASKASTGSVKVNLEHLDFGQLVKQALGEYETRFEQAGLTPNLKLSEEEFPVCVDGGHMWRVLDNLFGNCVKYALQGTRIYLDLIRQGTQVRLTVKNISSQPLNLTPEELIERFVQGDPSRSTEGSGLGLSIASNLVHLQGGRFEIQIDGDLFKSILELPLSTEDQTRDQEEQKGTTWGIV